MAARILVIFCALALPAVARAALPDWSGTWYAIGSKAADPNAGATSSADPSVIQLTAKALAMRAAVKADPTWIENAARCEPRGMPSDMSPPAMGVELLLTPGRVTTIAENGFVRRIYTDGRSHPPDPDPTFAGNSVGHWEGDTLVVDTIAITSSAELAPQVYETGKTHIVERMRRISADRLEIDGTVTDPDLLKRPWTYRQMFRRATTPMDEFVCTQDNRDGTGKVDLTPPAG